MPVGPISFRHSKFSNGKCYLSHLGGCSSKINKEHFISKNILKKITNSTLKFENAGQFFGGTQSVEIGINSFSSKVLCSEHNAALSPLDAAVGGAFESFEQISDDLLGVIVSGKMLRSLYVASGRDIERWMIKVYCGLVAAGKIITQSGRSLQRSEIPHSFFDTLINSKELPIPLGLYFNAFPGQELQSKSFSFATINLNDGSDKVGGLMLSLGIVNFVLVVSDGFGTSFFEPNWFRHHEQPIQIDMKGSKVWLVLTY